MNFLSPTDLDFDDAAAPKESLKQLRRPPRSPNTLELATPSGTFGRLVPPAGCTLAGWKRQLGSGEALGDKIVYPGRLRYHRTVGGVADPEPLEDAEPLPDSLAVFGPASLLQMLEMALVKRVGPPDPSRPVRMQVVELAALPSEDGGRAAALEFHFLSIQGHRPAQEDRACATADVPGCTGWASMFGVFDGHGGPQAADFVARRLPQVVGRKLSEDRGDPGSALTGAFAAVDEELRVAGAARGLYDLVGTTATVVLVIRAPCGRRRLYCASTGDSRAVLCRGGEAVDLSRDHKPELPEEGGRIRAAGGLVGPQGRIVLHGHGGLNMSRSLGDFAYKAQRHLAADLQMVIPHPEVRSFPVEEHDEFFAIGSDGVFDSFDNEELVTSIRGALSLGLPMDLVVKAPFQEALPSGDNTTLCLVRFG